MNASPAAEGPALDVVLVNWNSGEQLRACLASMAASRLSRVRLGRVVVVDNASTDASADELPAMLAGAPVRVLRNAANLGFARACNQGAAACGPDASPLLLFLNPDTVLAPDTLEVAAGFLAGPAPAQVGILGVQLRDADGRIARSCARLPNLARLLGRSLGLEQLPSWLYPGHYLRRFGHDVSRPVGQVMGAFFLVRRSLFDALAGFDERFFVYYEEVDFTQRALARGCTSYFLASTHVQHAGGGSSRQVKDRRLSYNLHSRLRYAGKHFSRPGALLVALATLGVEPLLRLGQAAVRADAAGAGQVLRGYRLLYAAVAGDLRAALRRGGRR